MKILRWLPFAAALFAAACTDDNADTPCSPACRAGEVCTYGVCTVACNPGCAAGQQCVIQGGASMCVSVDAAAPVDVADDLVTDTAPVDVVPVDTTPVDTAPVDTSPVDTGTPDASMTDATVDVPAMDATPDATDSAADVGDAGTPVDARDAAVDTFTPPSCGGAGQPCCGYPGSETACRDGLLCNATARGTCVAVTRAAGECVTTADCSSGRVCGGPTGCADRWCYTCRAPGPMPFDATCNAVGEGADCNSGVCQRGRCTYACSLGAAGESECQRIAAGAHCVAFYYGLNLNDAGTPSRWATLGYCVRGCQRPSDCTDGRACVASANLLDDRIDFVCQTTTRPGGAGATCTTGSQCQSGLCVNLGPGSAVCLAPCITDGDCPSTLTCRTVTLYRPISGGAYEARACLPR